MPYRHLSRDERTELSALLRAGHSLRSIASLLGRSPSTISRELRRNTRPSRTYHARIARLRARERRATLNRRSRKILPGSALERYLILKLRRYWSPEQIVGRLHLHHDEAVICHETIYKWIHEQHPELRQYLRCRKGKYRRRYGTRKRARAREEAKKRRIDTRPAIVETRKRLGDYEGDTIAGKGRRGYILTHAERRSGYLLADVLERATAAAARRAAVQRLAPLPASKRHTLTYDNGSEFAEHEFIERDTGTTVYFAYPYHAWERGTNENTNGLLRQFFPKNTSLTGLAQRKLDHYVHLINTRPRKRLGYRTPEEIFWEKCCTLG